MSITRRIFLATGALVGTGLAVGVGYLSTIDTEGMKPGEGHNGAAKLNAWIEIRPDNTVRIAVPRAEMGQGIYNGVAMLVAEELEIELDPKTVIVEHPDELASAYTNFAIAIQKRPEEAGGPLDWAMKRVYGMVPFILTGGSSSIVDAWTHMRVAGACARTMLIEAAAAKWGVDAAQCRAEKGSVVHSSGKRATYGELAADAAKLSPPSDPVLKTPDQFKVIGTPQARIDIPAKTRGEAKFGIDSIPEGFLVATIVQCPVFQGAVKSVDDKAALAIKGVKKVVNLGDAVGVIGETYWHAKKGAEALMIVWDAKGHDALSSETIAADYRQALDHGDEYVSRNDGDAATALKSGQVVEATYETPFLAHAAMEPMNATAVYKDGAFEVWAPNQSPTVVRWAFQAVNKNAKDVVIHTTMMGGGFGRRADGDVYHQVGKLAMAMEGTPVKLVWSREEDMQHDSYRPAALARMRAVLGSDGKPSAFEFKNATQSVSLSYSSRFIPFAMGGDKDPASFEGALELPYAIPNVRVATRNIETTVPLGFWRSVGHSNNGFFVESFIDELAVAAKADPMDYRRALLAGNPRLLALADMLKEKSGWTTPLQGPNQGERRGRGVSIHDSFRTTVGQVAEVTVMPDGKFKVDRIVAVVDCGTAINPDSIAAQIEGAIVYALSAASFGQITIDKGRTTQANFDTYDVVHMNQAPKVEVYIVPSRELPGGIGEPGTPPLFAAVTNAIFAATGKRVRKLPLTESGFTLAA
jgi:isoquinoline 1-oxidoreductase subunit beta